MFPFWQDTPAFEDLGVMAMSYTRSSVPAPFRRNRTRERAASETVIDVSASDETSNRVEIRFNHVTPVLSSESLLPTPNFETHYTRH